MAFCPNCGSQTSGSFCTSCGRPVGGGTAAVPPAAVPGQTAVPPSPQKKKSHLLMWVLVGIAGLVLLVGITVVGAGIFLVHKAKQAGLDPDLLKSNPALAVGKMVTAMNPDYEVLRVDEASGVIAVRDKRSGKMMRMNFEDAKQGKFVFEEEGKAPVTIETDSSGGGGIHMRSGEGSMDFGGSAKVPGWIPAYPGAQSQAVLASSTSEGESGTVSFLTTDPVETAGPQYVSLLTSNGYQIESQTKLPQGFIISAKNGNRTLGVIIGTDSGKTTIGVTYSNKN
ncbi:MAG: hypothetical protein IT160_04415 [Bryobacterales bacterium]|nr:hypothetical protein [Bryobacterales bacterium]